MKKIQKWLLLPVIMMAVTACDAGYRRAEGFIFGTYYRITYRASKDLHPVILEHLQAVDASLSLFNPASTLCAVNGNRGCDTTLTFSLSADTLIQPVLTEALTASALTEGAYDITVGPMTKVWGFGPETATPPTDAVVDSLLAFCGWRNLRWDPQTANLRKLDPRVAIDAGSIAKGFACDLVALQLRKAGVSDYLVDIGGEIVASGVNGEGKPWQVGIQTPAASAAEKDIEKVISMSGGAMATSGNYRNFKESGGKRYGHTLNPATGRPAETDLLSVTVMAPSCMTADAYATAFMVMGVDKSCAFIVEHPYLELRAFFIYLDADGVAQTRWLAP